MAEERLKVELETYEREKGRLVTSGEGRFVLICGNEVVGTWGTYEDALKAGYDKCGLSTPFLVKQISRVERVHYTSRVAPLCQP